ncbi:2-dehydro-3-deoxyphosphooctonate aldolase (KDO 8-P synthase) [Desulfacinum hydrothermale DSM 13146]|uniref:2-dehydro-3-deoxyphosphooctonate aldolase n=1 Tax=Desulfacinum hydrothermale DSM 13146 TaxID=1121390 RepID=A0A1W1XRZ3_9BACT|nr:3-deoxy-8-phosphooctulonate synthase [Desulfacinum hydrothermale]SMC26625.1 2-dehydro-3-deoxyphosphooctonate aldolase (KDO 8-P synthase) [Desulfacinum hydrothermale DSM 13146]
METTARSAASIEIGGRSFGKDRFFVIAGPCVLESEELAFTVARTLRDVCQGLDIPFIFKSSYDKANRTSIQSFRGPGLKAGLDLLGRIRADLGVPVLTDVHSVDEVAPVAAVVDVLQTPAFLARQTDLIVACARTNKPINIKKAQFLAPWDMQQVVAKAESAGNKRILVTERGSCFGYNNLVVDMRSVALLSRGPYPMVFDATHSVQLPGGRGTASGGQRDFVEPLARAAVAAGADGVFMEVHEDPDRALCDGANSLRLRDVPAVLRALRDIYTVTRKHVNAAR